MPAKSEEAKMRPHRTLAGHGRFVSMAVIALMAAFPIFGEEIAPPREIAQSPDRLETMRARPKAYGTQDYTVTVVPAIAFLPEAEGQPYSTSGSLGRFGPTNTLQNFVAPVDIPPGAIIDYIGLNSTTDAPFALGVGIYRRYSDGSMATVGEFSSTVHGWATDYNAAALGFYSVVVEAAYILRVQQGSLPTPQFFGHVEVWWRRQVSLHFTATFNDVPEEHQFFQFIEALAASGITAGCGNGNFCPDDPVTRGQMATFLAKALGLHWGAQR